MQLIPEGKRETTEELAAMRECVIFDLDGTFAFLGDRSRTMPAAPKAMRSTRRSTSSMRRSGAGSPETAVLLVSGREDRWRAETERWLERHGIIAEASSCGGPGSPQGHW